VATEPSRRFRYFEIAEPSIVLTVRLRNSDATEPSWLFRWSSAF